MPNLSRILSLIISVLTDPHDQFIDRLQEEGRIIEEEVRQLREALNAQIPLVSRLIKSKGGGALSESEP